MNSHKKILILAPLPLSARNILETDIPNLLKEHPNLEITFVSKDINDQKKISTFGLPNLCWSKMICFVDDLIDTYKDHKSGGLKKLKVILSALPKLISRSFLARSKVIYEIRSLNRALLFRFRAIEELDKGTHHEFKRSFCFFPKSKKIYNLLYRLNYSSVWLDPEVVRFLKKNSFDLMVISHLQNHYITPYIIAARKLGIPILGIIHSWDQPTSKGCLPPGITRYLVQSRYVEDALVAHHDVTHSQVGITGWTQMDAYHRQSLFKNKEDFLKSFGFPNDGKVIFYGANTGFWSEHEPDVISHLVQKIESGQYGEKICLVVRSHPHDKKWKEKYSPFERAGYVFIQKAEYDDLHNLANLLKYSDVVISSGGSVILDAVSFNNRVINLRFERESKYHIRRAFEKYHLIELLKKGGTKIADDYEELDQAIVEYLTQPNIDLSERQKLKEYFIDPVDGLSSQRTMEEIVRMIS